MLREIVITLTRATVRGEGNRAVKGAIVCADGEPIGQVVPPEGATSIEGWACEDLIAWAWDQIGPDSDDVFEFFDILAGELVDGAIPNGNGRVVVALWEVVS